VERRHDSKQARDRRRGDTPEALLLVRCWLEPERSGAPVVRGYIRDLRSGEETAVGSVDAVAEHLRRRLGLRRREGAAGARERIA